MFGRDDNGHGPLYTRYRDDEMAGATLPHNFGVKALERTTGHGHRNPLFSAIGICLQQTTRLHYAPKGSDFMRRDGVIDTSAADNSDDARDLQDIGPLCEAETAKNKSAETAAIQPVCSPPSSGSSAYAPAAGTLCPVP